MKKYYKESRRKETFYIKYNERRLTRWATSCKGTVFYNTLLKER